MKRAVIGLLCAVTLTACGGTATRASSDCAEAVRRQANVYVGVGVSQRPATRIGLAEQADCADVRNSPHGSSFPADRRKVDVWSFDALDQDAAVGVRQPDGSFQVLVAQGLPRAQVERISGTLIR